MVKDPARVSGCSGAMGFQELVDEEFVFHVAGRDGRGGVVVDCIFVGGGRFE